jgi:uncharacterized protein (TIGR00725 family)
MSGLNPIVISIIGASDCTSSQSIAAEEVGRLLAENGAIVVCGGRSGVMEAACRGAIEAGGLTIGLLPGMDPREGNPYLSVAIPTGLGHARNVLVARAGQVVIAIGGGYGTLSEIAMALVSGRAVIGLETWSLSKPDGQQAEIMRAKNPKDAVALALSVARDASERVRE